MLAIYSKSRLDVKRDLTKMIQGSTNNPEKDLKDFSDKSKFQKILIAKQLTKETGILSILTRQS
jgi:hypothetical protein